MNKQLKIATIATLGLLVMSRPVFAGVAFLFVMPQTLDPAKLSFTEIGKPYIRDDIGDPLIGKTFLPTVSSDPDFKGGLEVHGRINDPIGPTGELLPIDKLIVKTSFLDPLTVRTSVEPLFSAFDPWQIQSMGFENGPGIQDITQFIVFVKGPNGAPLLDAFGANNGFVGLFSAENPDNDQNFNNARFSIQAFATPEPGSVATLCSLFAAGALFAVRRTRLRKSP